MGYKDFDRLETEEPFKTFFSHIRQTPEYADVINPPLEKKDTKFLAEPAP
jgi:hypothetical protein